MYTRFYPQISHEAFVSPTDQAALNALGKMPAVTTAVSWVRHHSLDRVFYLQTTASAIRCGENQYPSLYAMLLRACRTLDMPVPELYVRQGEVNAFAAGVERHYICLESGLLESMTDDEILFVIGHELGHIKCGHSLYKMMASLLIPIMDKAGKAIPVPGSNLIGAAAGQALFEWSRQAEYSCDRAGLLVVQNYEAAIRALMKLGGGSSRFNSEMNIEAFLNQARAYDDVDVKDKVAKVFLFFMAESRRTHPHVIHRVKLLDNWAHSPEYRSILNGEYKRCAHPTPLPQPA